MSDTIEQNDSKTAQIIRQILVDWLIEKKAQSVDNAHGGNRIFSIADDTAVVVQLESLLPSDTALVIQIACNGLNLDLKLDLERKILKVLDAADIKGAKRVYFMSQQGAKAHKKMPVLTPSAEAPKKSGNYGVLWQLKPVPGVKKIVMVASGKGGVGKSTVSINLAAALNLRGASVGLVDADIYGPSAAMMLGIHAPPKILPGGKMEPLVAHGIKAISLGFLYESNQPAIWRGPMVAKAVRQLFYDVVWGELDYLIVDLPPGTGDVQLTIIENIPVRGALVVSSPQDIATLDALKAITMFSRLDIPVLGMIENMAYFECGKCHERHAIFGSGGVDTLAKSMGVEVLASLALLPEIRAGGDQGVPGALLEGSPAHRGFLELADKLMQILRQ